jgi:hypothetical protein
MTLLSFHQIPMMGAKNYQDGIKSELLLDISQIAVIVPGGTGPPEDSMA